MGILVGSLPHTADHGSNPLRALAQLREENEKAQGCRSQIKGILVERFRQTVDHASNPPFTLK